MTHPLAQLRVMTTDGRVYVTRIQTMQDALALHDMLAFMMREPDRYAPLTLRTFWSDSPFTVTAAALASVEVIPVPARMWKGDLWGLDRPETSGGERPPHPGGNRS